MEKRRPACFGVRAICGLGFESVERVPTNKQKHFFNASGVGFRIGTKDFVNGVSADSRERSLDFSIENG